MASETQPRTDITTCFSSEPGTYGYLDVKRIYKRNLIDNRVLRVLGKKKVDSIRNKLSHIVSTNNFEPVKFYIEFYKEILALDNLTKDDMLYHKYLNSIRVKLQSNLEYCLQKQQLTVVKYNNCRIHTIVSKLIDTKADLEGVKLKAKSLEKQKDLLETENKVYLDRMNILQQSEETLIRLMNQHRDSSTILITSMKDVPKAIKIYEEQIRDKMDKITSVVDAFDNFQKEVLGKVFLVDETDKMIQHYHKQNEVFDNNLIRKEKEISNIRKNIQEKERRLRVKDKEIEDLNLKLKKEIDNKYTLKKQLEDLRRENYEIRDDYRNEQSFNNLLRITSQAHDSSVALTRSVNVALNPAQETIRQMESTYDKTKVNLDDFIYINDDKFQSKYGLQTVSKKEDLRICLVRLSQHSDFANTDYWYLKLTSQISNVLKVDKTFCQKYGLEFFKKTCWIVKNFE